MEQLRNTATRKLSDEKIRKSEKDIRHNIRQLKIIGISK